MARNVQIELGDVIPSAQQQIIKDLKKEDMAQTELTMSVRDRVNEFIERGFEFYWGEDGYNYDLEVGNEYNFPAGMYSFDAPLDEYDQITKWVYVGAGKIVVSNEKNADGSWVLKTILDGDGLGTDTVGANNILANSIDTDHLATNVLTASNIRIGDADQQTLEQYTDANNHTVDAITVDIADLTAKQLTFSTQMTDLETRIGAESRLIIEDIIPPTPYRVNDYWIPAKQTNAMLAGYTNKQLFDAGTINLELFGQISYFSIKGRDSTESWNRTDWQASTVDGEPILTSLQRDMSELSSSHLLIKSDLERTTTKTNTNSTDIASLTAKQLTLESNLSTVSSKTNTNSTNIATLTAKQLTFESDLSTVSSTASTTSTKVTKIEAGNITLNSNTNGAIAGLTISSSTLRANDGTNGVQISGRWEHTPIWVGNSSFTTPVFKVDWSGKMTANNADITGKITATSGKIGEWDITKYYIESRSGLSRIYLANYSVSSSHLISIQNSRGVRQFGVDKEGHLVANSATIKGTIQAGSVINGSLSNTTGTHTGGTTGTHSGSLSNTTGTHTGGTTGTHSGGLRYTTGSHAGTLYGTTGNHNGSIYSSTGSLGGVPFKTYTSANTLQLQGNLNMYTQNISAVNRLGVATVNAQTVNYDFLVKNSDINLKQDIVDIPESAVDDLMRLDIKEFSYKDTPKKRHYGVIAQDVLRDTSREFSDIMVKPQDGYFTVSYESLVPVLVKTVQEQDKRIRELEEKIA